MITEIATFATEPELKTVQIGDDERSVMNGRIAVRQSRDHAAFINVTAWGKLAEYIGTYYKKGDEIYMEGEIRNANYKLGDRVLQTNYILITAAKPTFGQKSRRLAVAADAQEQDAAVEEQVEKPKRWRKTAADNLDDSK
jgi:single-stranded DNA-binding protein